MKVKPNLKKEMRSAVRKFKRGEHDEHTWRMVGGAIIALALFLGGFYLIFSAPAEFPVGTLIEVEEGTTGQEIAVDLKERAVVRSETALKIFAALLGGKSGMLHGEYYFEVPESVFGVAWRLTHGEFGLDAVKITIPEGATVKEIAAVLDQELPSFPEERFLEIAESKEGFLFPDTYLFLPNVAPRHIIEEMEANFEKQVATVERSVATSGQSLEDIVVMASIIEKEAIELEDKHLISGILWKRMEIGMPLQVDAPFVYAIGKNTFELTTKDLRTDNPYNTYTRKGLPPTPIANPGLESIKAALEPKESPYLFYLSDHYGNMHYAKNFEGHKRNKRLYLN